MHFNTEEERKKHVVALAKKSRARYREKNKEKINILARIYYMKNKEGYSNKRKGLIQSGTLKKRAYDPKKAASYYQKNKEAHKKRMRAWYHKNKERALAGMKRWRKNNQDYYIEYLKKWREGKRKREGVE